MSHSFLAFINSPAQLMVISVIVLILFGAKKLPMFARSLGRSMGEFRKAREEFEQELHSAADSVTQEPVTKAPEQKRIPTTTEV